jgi:branched-chain amino acid transport system ATP-binding protein
MTILEVQGLTKAFGGLTAVDRFELEMKREDLTAIIGPNGAGKSTLFNLITKHLTPDSGKALFKGKNITPLSPYEICRAGLGRSFQRANIFLRLTTFQNVQMAILSRLGKNFKLFSPARKLFNKEVFEILDSIGLSDQAGVLACNLSHGDQRRLEVAIPLALKPELLLLDEPTSGMAPQERFNMIDMIKNLARQVGLTLLFIEHDMDIVFSAAKRIVVMHQGRVIAEGSPAEVRANGEVQRIYLGEADDA